MEYRVSVKNHSRQVKRFLTFPIFLLSPSIAILVYRLPWTWKCSKLLMKIIHAGLNTVALILAIIALVAVFDFHNAKEIPNMYSLHSWIGLAAVILCSQQVNHFVNCI